MSRTRWVQLIFAGFVCCFLQAGLLLSIQQAAGGLPELSAVEQRYLFHEALKSLLPLQAVIAAAAGCWGFRICSRESDSVRWLDAVQQLALENDQLLHAWMDARGELRSRRETSENLAHQLRNTSCAGLLLADAGMQDSKEYGCILEKISALTTQFLDESVRPAYAPVFHFSAVDLRAILFRVQKRFPEGCIKVSPIETALPLFGDAFWLEEMLDTLLDNALEYGGGTVVTAAVKAAGQEGYELELSHSGTLRQSFEVRYQTTKSGHYGIGMSMARTVAARHKGTLQIREEDGIVKTRIFLPVNRLEM